MSSLPDRRFMEELSTLLQKQITIVTSDAKNYNGILSGVDSHTLNVCLTEAKDETGKLFPKLFLSGSIVTQIYSSEKPFNLQALADRLERVFPRMIKLNEEAGIIVVMERIRVSEKGIIEGTGPAAERVQKVYDEFVRVQTQ
ncbi:MAG TPA: Lsm family RNA-binding protein [Candidatus Bathyarchaeia archaeon]|nr:Lsm family RNA-binding protein [Candidatus Bathyarchaeia archaeon]